jgi:hypothetical protein
MCGLILLLKRRKDLEALPSVYKAVTIIGVGVGAGQTFLLIGVLALFALFGT